LSHDEVTKVIRHYQPLLSNGDVDGVFLVTQNGIVANALAALPDGMRHWSYRDLMDEVLAPQPLVTAMRQQFTVDALDRYYVHTPAYDLDVDRVCRNYRLFYNPFVEFALGCPNPGDFVAVTKEWHKVTTRSAGSRLVAMYDQETFANVVAMRLLDDRTELRLLVEDWIANASTHGLALIGSYGSGKSSFAQYLAWEYAGRFAEGSTNRLPLLIELRHFGAHQSVEALVTDRLVNHHGMTGMSFATFSYLNAAGRFLLILDGFDEMKQAMNRDSIVHSFSELNKLVVGRSKVLLCGRPSIFMSDLEQSEILAAGDDYFFEHSARYVQVNLAPLEPAQILQALAAYVTTRGDDEAAAFATRSAELAKELANEDQESELRLLLSRPVHLSMLIKALPSLTGPLARLRRAALYRSFIDYTIQRDVTRSLHGQDAARYSTEQRRQFARAVAMEMWRSGETRSIRAPLLPDSLYRPYKRRTETMDEVRRSLVAACFLERRPPDQLTFAHLSYAEFLVAETVVDAVVSAGDSDSLDIRYTSEVLSFVAELMPSKGWRRLMTRIRTNNRIVAEFLNVTTMRLGRISLDPAVDDEAFGRVFLTEAGLTELTERLTRSDSAVFGAVASYGLRVAENGDTVTPALNNLLRALVALDCGVPSVKAYQALKVASRMDNAALRELIGVGAYQQWVTKKWVDFPKLD
jgi:hypothetical protein